MKVTLVLLEVITESKATNHTQYFKSRPRRETLGKQPEHNRLTLLKITVLVLLRVISEHDAATSHTQPSEPKTMEKAGKKKQQKHLLNPSEDHSISSFSSKMIY